MTEGRAFPVIVCDACGYAVPARFAATHIVPAVNEQQRISDLRAEGWRLSATLDTCPTCTAAAHGV